MDKTVTILAYFEDATRDNFRGKMAEVLDGVDVWKKSHSTSTTRKLDVGGKEFDVDDEILDVVEDADSGDIRVKEKTHSSESFRHSKQRLARKWLDRVVVFTRQSIGPLVPDTYGTMDYSHPVRERDECVNTYISFREKNMLVHESERDGVEGIETDEGPYPCVRIRVTAKNMDPELVGKVDEMLTEPLVRILRRENTCDRVRVLKCEMETTERGVCHLV